MISSSTVPAFRSNASNDNCGNIDKNIGSNNSVNVCDEGEIRSNDSKDTTVTVLSKVTTKSNHLPPTVGSLRSPTFPSVSSTLGGEGNSNAAAGVGGTPVHRPRLYVEEVFRSNGFCDFESIVSSCKSRVKPITEDMLRAYSGDIVAAVRNNDVNLVRSLYEDGDARMRIHACNRFGESVLHMACRRGHAEMVKFLVLDIGMSVTEIRDDYERTPLHDAFWAAFGSNVSNVVDFLLKQPFVTELLLCEDLRGFTPLDYTREEDRDSWFKFLSERKSELLPHETTRRAMANTTNLIAVNEPRETSEKKRRRSGSLILEETVDKEKTYADFSTTRRKEGMKRVQIQG